MERFEVVKKLGEGVYGNVYMAIDKESGTVVAVKCFKAQPEYDISSTVQREAHLLKAAKHPNVVQLRDTVHTAPDGRMFLVTEFVDYTLKDFLLGQPEGQGLPETSAKLMMWQILQGTAYLHLSKIIHRDLTPSNILCSAAGIVKLCDFGFARSVNPGDGVGKYTPYVTTRWYRPPELLVGAPYGPPADVWAIGCLFAEMMTGRPVFPGKDILDQLGLISKALGPLPEWQQSVSAEAAAGSGHRGAAARPSIRVAGAEVSSSLEHRYPSFSQPMMQVLKACLHPDPVRRSTAREVLSLPYWDDIHEHTRGTELQQVYDAAYSAALRRGSPSAPCLWASSTACLEARAFNVMLASESRLAAGEGVGETHAHAGQEAERAGPPASRPAEAMRETPSPQAAQARPSCRSVPAAAAAEPGAGGGSEAGPGAGAGAAGAGEELCGAWRGIAIPSAPRPLSSYCSTDSEPGVCRPGEEPGHASPASSAHSNHSARDALGRLALGSLSLSLHAAAPHGHASQRGGHAHYPEAGRSKDAAAAAAATAAAGARVKRGSSTDELDAMFATAPQAIRPNKQGKVHEYALAGSLPTPGHDAAYLWNSARSDCVLGSSMHQQACFLLGSSQPDSRTRINRR